MKAKTIIAAVLIAAGVIVLSFSGISFDTPGETVGIFGFNIETVDRHFIPPIFGAIALVAGVILLLIKPRPF